ncbi:glycoside hydrolase family 5 protein [Nocardia stercoris]|uniref:Glycosidase n=1 Tax=Nocardia stercoris TaxID=2483361 RepID=A0A3M2L7R5_9NOCA|nr:cellulase family glycosylhydrolase [Nocardia stercoris]RMI32760.1 glycosidase [Nocardia stercoris]
MRSTRKVAMFTAALAASTALVTAAPAAHADTPAPQITHSLHATHGNDARIVDDRGRTVLLRGVNVNGLGGYYQEWPDLPPNVALTEDDYAAISARGHNVVRMVLSWSRIEPQRGVFDPGYLDLIAQNVEWARRHDIYVILDMHQDAWGPAVNTPDGTWCPPFMQPSVGWDGAPAWATSLAGTMGTCRIGMREISLSVQSSFQRFYDNADGIQDEQIKAWQFVAARFADNPAIAGYDLLNEPNPGLLVGIDDYVLLGNYYKRVVPALRATETATRGGFHHIAFFEPGVISSFLPLPGPLPSFVDNDNAVYSPHLYNESGGLAPGTIEDGFDAAATAARNYGTTLLSGEYYPENLDQWHRYAAQEDSRRIGGTMWHWKGACGDPHAIQVRHTRPACATQGPAVAGWGTTTDPDTLAVISRPYARATPGTLTALGPDIPSGALTVAGQTTGGGATADLWVPQRCSSAQVTGQNVGVASVTPVPGGYRVTVPVPSAGDYRIAVTCG